MRSLIALILIFAIGFSLPNAFAQITSTDTLYSCGSSNGTDIDVHLRDKLTGVSISSNSWSIEGLSNIQGCFGLTQDPNDFQWYAIIEDTGSRFLALVNPSTGTGSLIGSTEDNTVYSLAIGNDGTMYSADGSDNIVTLNKFTGAKSFKCEMDQNGDSIINRVSYNYVFDNLLVITESVGNTVNVVRTSNVNQPLEGTVASCPSAQHSSNLVDPNFNPLMPTTNDPEQICLPLSWAFHTEDLLYYGYNQDCYLGGNEYYVTYNAFPEGKFVEGTFDITLLNANPLSNSTSPSGNTLSPLDSFTFGLQFAFLQPDSVAPVISAIGSEPITIIQGDSFDAFEFVQCIDNQDGTIVPNGNFATDGGITIDTSVRGLQTQDYTCTDVSTNTGLATIEYIIKQHSSSGSSGGSSSSSSSGGTFSGRSIPQLSDIPTLSFKDSPSQPPQTERIRGQSINDLFKILFSDRLNPANENVQQAQSFFGSPQPSGSPALDRSSPSVVDFFRNLFSSWFG